MTYRFILTDLTGEHRQDITEHVTDLAPAPGGFSFTLPTDVIDDHPPSPPPVSSNLSSDGQADLATAPDR
jgi:hypothetical protein